MSCSVSRWGWWVLLALAPVLLVGLVQGVQLSPTLDPELTAGPEVVEAQVDTIAAELGLELDAPHSATWISRPRTHRDVVTQLTVPGARAAMAEGLLTPVRWCETRVQEEPPLVLTACVRPDGTLQLWSLEEPDDTPGPALAEAEALTLARAALLRTGVDVTEWRLKESTVARAPSGRTVHELTWERDGTIGLAVLRAQAVVSGDRVVDASTSLTSPEIWRDARSRSRSVNDRLALVATLIGQLFAVIGVALALAWRRELPWRWVLGVTLVLGLAAAARQAGVPGQLARSYDPTVATWADHVSSTFAEVLTWWMSRVVTAGAAAVAAGGLLRRWWPDVLAGAGGPPTWTERWRHQLALGVGLALALFVWECVYYRGIGPVIGVEMGLAIPGSIPTGAGVVQALGGALWAGLWEELAFRVVPIGTVLWACRRWLGERGAGMAAVALSAILFAALHADYPQDPWWARVVEIVPPALVAGWIVWRVGPLPAVVAHVLYDFVLMSRHQVDLERLELALACGALVALPLGLALVGERAGRGEAVRFRDLHVAPPTLSLAATRPWLPRPLQAIAVVLALPGAGAVWLGASHNPLPPLEGRRHEVVDLARAVTDAPPDAVARVEVLGGTWSGTHAHVEEHSETLLRDLLADPLGPLPPPRWSVELVPHADPQGRRWTVMAHRGPTGWTHRVVSRSHDPEPAAPVLDAVRLDESAAEALCRQGWPDGLEILERQATARRDRTDWRLDGARTRDGVEERYRCELRGERVHERHAWVQQPASKRLQEARSETRDDTRSLLFVLGLLPLWGLGLAIAWQRGRGEPLRGRLLKAAGLVGLLYGATVLAAWPGDLATLTAERALGPQRTSLVMAQLVQVGGLGLFGGLCLAIATRRLPPDPRGLPPWLLGPLGILAVASVKWLDGWPEAPDEAPELEVADLWLAELGALDAAMLLVLGSAMCLPLLHLIRVRWVGPGVAVALAAGVMAVAPEMDLAPRIGLVVALWLTAQAPRATVWALALLLMASPPILWREVPYEGARGQALLAALLLVGLAAVVTGLARPRSGAETAAVRPS